MDAAMQDLVTEHCQTVVLEEIAQGCHSKQGALGSGKMVTAVVEQGLFHFIAVKDGCSLLYGDIGFKKVCKAAC